MTSLAQTSILVGAAVVALRLPGLIAPAKIRPHVLGFPRSVGWGRGLMGVVALWSGVVLWGAATDDWAWARPLVMVGVPLAYWLVIQFGDQFLAIRATGALTLLIAKLMVTAADRSESPARLVVTVLAYLWVVAAIWMTISPHQARDLVQYWMASDRRCRLGSALGAAVGLVLLLLGLFVY